MCPIHLILKTWLLRTTTCTILSSIIYKRKSSTMSTTSRRISATYSTDSVMSHSMIIVFLVLITGITTWWYDHRTEQKDDNLFSHGIEPYTCCLPSRRINHFTRKECLSHVSFRLMFAKGNTSDYKQLQDFYARGIRCLPEHWWQVIYSNETYIVEESPWLTGYVVRHVSTRYCVQTSVSPSREWPWTSH